MEKVIKLPSGAEVTLRDPSELRQKDREKMWSLIPTGENDIVAAGAITSGLMAVLIKSWTLDLIIPSVMYSSLGELTMADYDVLASEVRKHQDIIFPNFTTGEDNPDPKSEQAPDAKYPEKEYLYYKCAKEFGWTIEETRNQPAYYLDWIIAISTALELSNDSE